ncbi:hypothetical protein K7T73_07130 [Bacillus badius]|uniref:hypothetical protein n=1 Tax=Bacillus badius TaxID=1455 RepID=UPI001CBCFFA2|nr:hypothetical protein [Bacillus badius]UAT31985.1 hypothetical protein K7T73_07130 [Bacillus badius]
MSEYGKLFKKNTGVKTHLCLRSYNPEKDKYFEVIKSARKEGLKQVIVNSEIMTNILYSTLKSGGIILKINLSDSTDQDIKDNIKAIIPKLKSDLLLFVKLKEELEWAMDSGSIDIHSIDIYILNRKYTIYSNGIIYGEKLEELFENTIKPVLEEYFRG